MTIDDGYSSDSECISSDDESADDNFYSNHESTFEMLHDEMKGRVHFEQDSVWTQLKVDEVEVDLVKACCQQLEITCKNDIDSLKWIVDPHTWRPETEMYPFLSNIFEFISNFTIPSSTLVYAPIRRFFRSPGLRLQYFNESYLTGFPQVSPGFQLERIDGDTPNDKNGSHYWKNKDGFCEVKVVSRGGPPTSNDPIADSEILSQSANYARLHMSARPFLLFSIGLLIYGTRFCVCIFDRAGVRISPELGLWSNLDVFVRVVRSLTCVLNAQDIGQDPTARLLKKPSEPDSYVIKPIGNDKRSWRTIGSPIWSSLSLFGRGTVVWRIAEYNEEKDSYVGPTMVMKTAWRSAQRNPESCLSRYVTAIARNDPDVSVAEFVTGGDVYAEGGSPPDVCLATESSTASTPGSSATKPEGTLISVPFLRLEAAKDGDSPILHRVITSTVGRPLWEYKDDKELARGFIAVLQTHKKLCELNVLHRDISPGNILLAENPEAVIAGREGFLSDFELARVGDEVGVYVHERVGSQAKRKQTPTANENKTVHILSGSGTGRHAPITGTLQFMAVELLNVIVSQARLGSDTRIDFKQNEHHDLESIIWVFGYIQLRKMLVIATSRKKEYRLESNVLNEEFERVFGKVKVVDIRDQRQLLAPLGWIGNLALKSFLDEHLPKKLADLIGILYRKMHQLYDQKQEGSLSVSTSLKDPDQSKRKEGKKEDLTHDYLIYLFRQIVED